jgi:hypothetical protein
MCATRREAIRDGSMFYSSHRRGWIYPAENRHVPRSMIRNGVPPATWPFCPFCFGALPDEVSAVERMLKPNTPTFGEGEE